MRAARFYGKEDIRVEEIEEIRPDEKHLLVDVEWCGICGSDLHEFIQGPMILSGTQAKDNRLPVAQGHEFCGRVNYAPDGSKFKVGDKVMVDPRFVCRSCPPCNNGNDQCCQHLAFLGYVNNGGFSERVGVEEIMLHPIPDNVPLENAAIIEPLAVVHHAIKASKIQDWSNLNVLVLGAGPIGMAMIIALRANGARNIVVSEPASVRLQQVSDIVLKAVNPIDDNVGETCMDLTRGFGMDVAFDCAGVPAAFDAGFEAMKVGSIWVNVAVWEKPFVIPMWKWLLREVTIIPSLAYNSEDFVEVMQMMAEDRFVDYEKMITARITLDEIVDKGFKELIHNKDTHIKILVSPKRRVVG